MKKKINMMAGLPPKAEVLIKTESGEAKKWVELKDIKVGDTILGYDPETHTQNWTPVKAITKLEYSGTIHYLHRTGRRGQDVVHCPSGQRHAWCTEDNAEVETGWRIENVFREGLLLCAPGVSCLYETQPLAVGQDDRLVPIQVIHETVDIADVEGVGALQFIQCLTAMDHIIIRHNSWVSVVGDAS